jgi:DNA gyrase inhibitor GyrI
MLAEPIIVHRAAQPYVGERASITMTTFPAIADRLPQIFAWLTEHGVVAAEAPFFRYRVIDMEHQLVVEAGVPVTSPVQTEGETFNAVLPAGLYATITHVGHPAELVDTTARLLRWAQEQGLAWDMAPSPEGEVWGCRLEILKTNPAEEPDITKWETELAFRLAD